ncbi:ribokinase [Barrientosiimonas marina]|uniref:Ribokinase n=1 Tax=Lentibacillus kimchii TaxID=1542911 RepID=A0ABW2UYQ3_9BACI
MSSKPNVCIVGSINMDLTVTTESMPMQGETVLGDQFFTNPGGKGANQAVAAARMGADVTFIGAVGDDPFGKHLLENLRNEGVAADGVDTMSESATGTATIILSDNDNRIIVAPGANRDVTSDRVAEYRNLIQNSDIVLLQLEVPMDTIAFTAEAAEQAGVPVVLNPAPFQSLPEEVLNSARYMTPNEIELASLQNEAEFPLIKEKSIVTRGEQGVSFVVNGAEQKVPSHAIQVKDTTGAGDTFNGALAAELASGTALERAVATANAAAALSVEKIGAQGGMPYRQDVVTFLQGKD